MAVIIRTSNPKHVLNLFKSNVANRDITTWLVDLDGDFTIANPKWTYMAWMRPMILEDDDRLVFGFVSSRKYEITKGLYGIFHGRLATTILSHYDNIINSIEIEPQLNPEYDVF